MHCNTSTMIGKTSRKRAMRPFLFLLTAALTMFPAGCSGTGSMFVPEAEDASYYGTSGDMYSDAFDGENLGVFPGEPGEREAGGPSEADHDSPGSTRRNRGRAPQNEQEEPEEEPREKTAYLQGTGSDMYSASTVDYYYGFTLEGTSLQLPCGFSSLLQAGWEISLPGAERPVPGYSYEFVNAVPIGSQEQSAAGSDAQTGIGAQQSQAKTVRLCLANFNKDACLPADCTVCGISAAADSGVSLETAFGAGLGSTPEDLTSVFGTDSSIYTLTEYYDGTRTLRYCFSNGLAEGEEIPVLAEAEEKSLAEMILADTDPDGKTITSLSIYYFRQP
ncbi:MAG: hypothetical protein IKD92_02820 [Lachnospiraceae bacterium]|nr:hypothetical protein [Lachnospiraceae bacterium]